MRTFILGLAAAGLLAGCSEPAAKKAEVKKVDALQPGEYELTMATTELRSTDKTTPATSEKVGPEKVLPERICIGAESVPPNAFAATGDKCTPLDSYLRGGRISLQFRCDRAGRGQVTQTVDGTFAADSFEAEIITATLFSGSGDYAMTQTVTGRRVGDCAAGDKAK